MSSSYFKLFPQKIHFHWFKIHFHWFKLLVSTGWNYSDWRCISSTQWFQSFFLPEGTFANTFLIGCRLNNSSPDKKPIRSSSFHMLHSNLLLFYLLERWCRWETLRTTGTSIRDPDLLWVATSRSDSSSWIPPGCRGPADPLPDRRRCSRTEHRRFQRSSGQES